MTNAPILDADNDIPWEKFDMAHATHDPNIHLTLSVEEARALVILISTKVKGSFDPITQALFDVSDALFKVGINYDSGFKYGTVEIENKNGKVRSSSKVRDFTGISFRDVPDDVLTWSGDDYY